MAKMYINLPTEVIKELESVYGNLDNILGEMTRAGATVALQEMINNCPNPIMRPYMKLTRTYRTPSDGGINTKAQVNGYIPFSDPNRKYFSRRGANGTMYHTTKGVPAAFLANLYEYGRSTSPFPKTPFVRKAFNQKDKIKKAMLQAQKTASGGLLDDE